jgi:hypothetical protein
VGSSVETMGAFNTSFDTVNPHRPTQHSAEVAREGAVDGGLVPRRRPGAYTRSLFSSTQALSVG